VILTTEKEIVEIATFFNFTSSKSNPPFSISRSKNSNKNSRHVFSELKLITRKTHFERWINRFRPSNSVSQVGQFEIVDASITFSLLILAKTFVTLRTGIHFFTLLFNYFYLYFLKERNTVGFLKYIIHINFVLFYNKNVHIYFKLFSIKSKREI